ncbi:uncharacterized protein LOC8288949 [Ricinus communis]|uniref:Uncharacterized protein n=1 Tax=Ricinus communis TaxID=3988 RepID=B9R7W4_RICCO|nr:uncharacterized protein LOC8288949 [Ricinus communis]EEF52594.1 conserved hypothetical protein [Ricinus communis]|eukprot:XP_002510407.1 uncharacterized protein LOC8288949 [Ricinus communis]
MGSLMAGWDSPVLDPKSVKYKKNWSFTKEEIEAYWKLKKKTEEEHLKAISTPSEDDTNYDDNDGIKLKRSSSLPEARTKEKEKSLEKLITENGWWTRSNWAFLNEPPVLDRSSNTYASQFHIANFPASKPNNNTGIST